MKASQYIAQHPRSYLAQALVARGYADEEIIVDSGIVSSDSRSKCGRLQRQYPGASVVVGGRADRRASAGHVFAIVLEA